MMAIREMEVEVEGRNERRRFERFVCQSLRGGKLGKG